MVSPYLNPLNKEEEVEIISQTHSWVEISKDALRFNLKSLRSILPKDTKIIPVLKSNAYGHGLLGAARIASEKEESNGIAVVSINEALALRKTGIKNIPILVLSYPNEITNQDLIREAAKNNISLSVNSFKAAQHFNNSLKNNHLKVHVKIDTGTSRLGIFANMLDKLLADVKKLNKLEIEALWTHYSSSELADESITDEQFTILAEVNKKHNLPIHAACSAAALTHLKSQQCDWVRFGISFYGLWPSNEIKTKSPEIKLKPALTWKTKVLAVRQLKAGTFIGYNRTYKLKKDSFIATLAVGYADGYDRALSNNGSVIINGQKAPIRGNICMNLTMVDVSDIDEVSVGDTVTLLGTEKEAVISAEEIADLIGTINYEVVTRINWDLPRIYK